MVAEQGDPIVELHRGLSRSLNLLVLEDVIEDVELIALALAAADLDCQLEPIDSLSRFEEVLQCRTYDAVLSDYRLPEFNGLQAFERLRRLQLDMPFILVTGSLGEEAAVDCIKRGMTDYVLKDRLFRLPTVLIRALNEFELRRQQQAAMAQLHQQAWRDAVISRVVQAMRGTLVLDAALQTTVDCLQAELQVDHCWIAQPEKTVAEDIHQLQITHIDQATALAGAITKADLWQRVSDRLLATDRERLLAGQMVVLPPSLPNDSSASMLQTMPQDEGLLPPSMVLVPLVYQQFYRGILGLYDRHGERSWTESERVVVEAIAHQCAIAIHQADLYHQVQNELLERKKIEARLRHDAFHDALTGLGNRALLINRLQHNLDLAARYRQRHPPGKVYQFAVLFLDLDRFKVINDSLGHAVGDQLLQLVAQRLSACLRQGDTVARLGGDEFVFLLEDITDLNDVMRVVQRIQQALKIPIHLENHEIFVSGSIGITLNTADYTQPAQLLRDADTAMYRAKERQREAYEIFDASMHTSVLHQLQVENDLQRAIARQEFRLHYQPIFSLETELLSGFEVLIRWHHPEKGLLLPSQFITVAEATGFITELDRWVLQAACDQLRCWRQHFPRARELTLNVNLSGRQFSQAHLIDYIDQVLAANALDGHCLSLEVTESSLIENAEATVDLLRQLHQRGIRVCLDDFGTGYSSLSYLRRFPIHTLKIDRSFITQLDVAAEDSEIIKTIIQLGHTLGLTIVAEGIETAHHLTFLQMARCHAGQGYYFSPPVDSETATRWF
jgi:diguanylate cyclase (GGDEF)-like protein